MLIQCSNCGHSEKLPYRTANVAQAIRKGWDSHGNALYCPKCAKAWNERNTKPLSGKWNTIRVLAERNYYEKNNT